MSNIKLRELWDPPSTLVIAFYCFISEYDYLEWFDINLKLCISNENISEHVSPAGLFRKLQNLY